MSENLNSVILTNEKDKTDMKEQENIIASESQNEASEQVTAPDI